MEKTTEPRVLPGCGRRVQLGQKPYPRCGERGIFCLNGCEPAPSATETFGATSIAKVISWLDRTHGAIELQRTFGKWYAHIGWRHLHGYSDASGEHATSWSITRTGEGLETVIDGLLEAALRAPGQNVGAPVAKARKVDAVGAICVDGRPCAFHREGGGLEEKCPGYCDVGGCRDEEVTVIDDEVTGDPMGFCHAHAAEYHRAKAGL